MTPKKKEKFRMLAKKLRGLTDDQKLDLVARGGIKNVLGHTLSLNNTVLLLLQRVGVTVVGGYRQWQSVDRQVEKGEHGMMIRFPVLKADSQDADSEDAAETHFFIGNVFDISQTKPMQQPG